MPRLVGPGSTEDVGRDRIGRKLLEDLEEVEEGALAEDVHEEGGARVVLLREQALQAPLRRRADRLQPAAARQGPPRKDLDVARLVDDLRFKEKRNLGVGRVDARDELGRDVQGDVLRLEAYSAA